MLSIPNELSDLKTVEMHDRETFSAALEHSSAKSWFYYFPYLHLLWKNSKTYALLYEQVEGAILTYRLRAEEERLRLSLFLPPFPFHPAPLRLARERIRDFNHGRTSQIVQVQESDALLVAREGFEISFSSGEYIYDRAAVVGLEGSSFSRLRRSISQYADQSIVVREYKKDDQRACKDLRNKWYNALASKGVKLGPYYHYSASCLEKFEDFPSDMITGQVVEVAGSIRAFSFGGPIRGPIGSVFITISDHEMPGLAYLQRYHLLTSMPQLTYFNDSYDVGRPGLAQVKRAFRPVEMHGIYSAREQTPLKNSQISVSAGANAQRIENKVEHSKNSSIIQSIINRGENDFTQSPYLSWKGDIARTLIADAALRRGYKVDTEWSLVFRVSDGDNSWIFSQNDPDGSVVADIIEEDKHLTKTLLSRSGIPVPVGEVFADQSAALEYFRSRRGPQVVKPQSGFGGRGVTAGIRDERAFLTAWQNARARRIIVEDFFEGDEVRIIVLGGRVVAAVCRVPAYVVGNGASSISDLVSEKNKRRKNNPLLKIYPIKKFDQLELDGRSLDEVPGKNEYVRLSTVSNVGQGGESVSVMDHLHPSIIDMAEKAFHAIPSATLLGMDVLIKDFSANAGNENTCIVELNTNPAIATPFFAAYGPPSSMLPDDLLDFVASGRYETARRADWYEKPTVLPASIYIPQYGGETSKREYSTQVGLLRQAAEARNLQVEALSDELTVISNGERSTVFFRGMPSCTRIVARRASNNKEWTKRLLQQANITTPEGKVFSIEAKENAWKFAQQLSAGVGAVVKPTIASGGKGISTNNVRPADFEVAWKFVSETGTKSVLVEEHWPGRSYRVLVIGNAVRAVAERASAYIVGDGAHTIEQLVASKNERRRDNPYLRANLIKLTPMVLHRLAASGVSQLSVPESGQYIHLHSAASIGLGGEARDVTDLLHAGFSVIANKVRKVMYDPLHVGIDLIAEDITLSPEGQRWAVVGVSANPEFGMHQLGTAGVLRDVAGALIETLFPAARNTQSE
ncbi:ATP-grasp domain-containing protein [Microvirga soli]|uniref:ATP-grasp domain-containing protein n=1 Tax=Microvirga soli TaxID=1854496 RepID=UPI00191CFE8D|nr:ATP-grasp domain-containing protein [Microvirga soli]